MDDSEFGHLLGKLRREFDANEVADITARLLEALRDENKALRRIVQELIDER